MRITLQPCEAQCSIHVELNAYQAPLASHWQVCAESAHLIPFPLREQWKQACRKLDGRMF